MVGYPSAKALWNTLEVTYGVGGDALQTYDLHVKASEPMRRYMPLEQYFNTLQRIWQATDKQHPIV